MFSKARFILAVTLICCLSAASGALAQAKPEPISTDSQTVNTEAVAEVLFIRGVATAHQEGKGTRILGRGVKLEQGDVVSTSSSGFLIMQTVDKGRITLRPNTVMAMQEFRYRPKGKARDNRAVLRLFKGGLRAISGFVTKKNPDRGMSVVSPVATLGIRGTEFDTRICQADCANEDKQLKNIKQRRPRVVARMAFTRGEVIAYGVDGKSRKIVTGGALFRKEEVQTAAGASAVIVFRDNTRITVRPDTRFKIERFRFRKKQPEKNDAIFRLAKGGLRILTGLVGKQNHEKFRVNTPVATIGVRGTNFDVRCEGACASANVKTSRVFDAARMLTKAMDFLFVPAYAQSPFSFGNNLAVFTRQGETNLQLPGQAPFPIPQGRVGALPVGGQGPTPRLLPSIPPSFTNDTSVKPETVSPNTKQRFGTEPLNVRQPGQFTTVYKGNVRQQNQGGAPVNIGRGESAVTLRDGKSGRLPRIPNFILQDPTPTPNSFDPETGQILPKAKPRSQEFQENDEKNCKP